MSLLQKIFSNYKRESKCCDELAKALEDLRNCVMDDELMPESVSYMREAQKQIILYKVRKQARIEHSWKAIKAILAEEEPK